MYLNTGTYCQHPLSLLLRKVYPEKGHMKAYREKEEWGRRSICKTIKDKGLSTFLWKGGKWLSDETQILYRGVLMVKVDESMASITYEIIIWKKNKTNGESRVPDFTFRYCQKRFEIATMGNTIGRKQEICTRTAERQWGLSCHIMTKKVQ